MHQHVAATLVVLAATACGDSDSASAGGEGGAQGVSGHSGHAGDVASAGAGGGSAAGNSHSASGAGGTSTHISCEGAFGEPRLLWAEPAGIAIGGLAISNDELELIYALKQEQTSRFMHTVRASKSDVFPAGEPIAELDTACDSALNRSGDLSDDGLRFYFTCYEANRAVGDLHLARRTSVSAPFAMDGSPFGQVGSGVSISKDELTLYTSSLDALDGPVLYTRQSPSAVFGNGILVPGLSREIVFTPEISPDGLELFANSSQSLAVSVRTSLDSDFSAPEPLLTVTQPVVAYGSPSVSADCRSLYFIGVSSTPGSSTYSVYVMTR